MRVIRIRISRARTLVMAVQCQVEEETNNLEEEWLEVDHGPGFGAILDTRY